MPDVERVLKRTPTPHFLHTFLFGTVLAFCFFTMDVKAEKGAVAQPSGTQSKSAVKPCIPGFSKDSWNCLNAGKGKKKAAANIKKPAARIKNTPAGNRNAPTSARPTSGKASKKAVKARKFKPGLKGSSDAPALG